MSAYPAPPFDSELSETLAQFPESLFESLSSDNLASKREMVAGFAPSIEQLLSGRAVEHVERFVPGPHGAPDVILSIFTAKGRTPGGPALYHIHGGGMVSGDRLTGVDQYLDFVESVDLVLVSVEYRLAPEHPDPAPVEDCYAGLLWLGEHVDELQYDLARLLVGGGSAGGGLAAGIALMARDRGGPRLAGQILSCPMLDDRNDSVSSKQIDGIGVWDRASNASGWSALLGNRRGTDEVSIYAAPGRAIDLSGLPPAFIDVGSAEVFRDESLGYASRIWASGGTAELHVWSGGFHGFQSLAPESALARQANEARDRWFRRLVGVPI